MYLRHLIVSLAIISSAFSGSGTAQASDSLRFHRGQWGVEFNVTNGFFGAGALHFTSPTHAWLAALDGEYTHVHTTGPLLSSGNGGTVGIELGSRAYHAFNPRLNRILTVGVLMNYARQTSDNGASTTATGFGLFGDLGATWLVTSRLGIGAQWRASVAYGHGKSTISGSTNTSELVTFSAASVRLSGQLYF